MPLARFGLTSLSNRHVKIIVRMMYMLMKKLNMDENLRELRFRGRDIGNTTRYYRCEICIFVLL